jgi:hypothetical protein
MVLTVFPSLARFPRSDVAEADGNRTGDRRAEGDPNLIQEGEMGPYWVRDWQGNEGNRRVS